MNLTNFLQTKELYYKDIDYDYMPNLWSRVKDKFISPKVIHIIGTNGKGSTGRFLAHYLYKSGFKVGHYSSPHITRFNERIWLNGYDASDEILENSHQILLTKLDSKDLEKLSYFEYTTLLAIEVFKDCDFVVLEAGLGGEYDATNIFEKLFTLVTPISIDHQNFLGDTLAQIATTKLKSITTFAIMTKQEEIVYQVAKRLNISYHDSKDFAGVEQFLASHNLASYLAQNLNLALTAIQELGLKIDLSLLNDIKLTGRFQKILPNLIVDVGHNEKAALAIKKELKDKKVILIYNTYHDKNYKTILKTLKSNIEKVAVIDIDNERILPKEKLFETLKDLNIEYEEFSYKLNPLKLYLAFGSFLVVEKISNSFNTIMINNR